MVTLKKNVERETKPRINLEVSLGSKLEFRYIEPGPLNYLRGTNLQFQESKQEHMDSTLSDTRLRSYGIA